jgi:hypothetical protein
MTRLACLVAALVQKGYLLTDDVSRVMQRAGDTWDLVVRDAGTQR